MEFAVFSWKNRIKSMIKLDFRRIFTMPLFYIMIGISFVMPILILVMTSMMAGTESIDPATGEVTIMEGFSNVWQTLGSVSGESSGMAMDLVSMCNINMMFFIIAVLVCIFISDDFRSGYSKNLFTVRSNKKDYIVSKTLVGFVGGVSMILAYFIGSMIGGGISGLSFELNGIGINEIIMCLLSKMFLVAIFVSIYVLMSIIAKQKLWLSIILSLAASMLLFTMVPMITPLNSGIINVMMCLIGGVLFAIGLGTISNIILSKKSIL